MRPGMPVSVVSTLRCWACSGMTSVGVGTSTVGFGVAPGFALSARIFSLSALALLMAAWLLGCRPPEM